MEALKKYLRLLNDKTGSKEEQIRILRKQRYQLLDDIHDKQQALDELAGYGLYCFHKANILSYMFLKNQFVFFDFEQPAYLVFAEYAAMMGFFVFAAYYIAKIIGWLGKKTKRKKNHHEKN